MGQTKNSRISAADQRVDPVPTVAELRKGVNVLNTSDPKNPAPNPFVQQQAAQSQTANNGSKGKQK
jgi:hypothetical protein